ncbi:MAG: hypothetical protein NUV97_04455 [archaeon]|nr:hypothetical protein [archaeon]
MSQNKIKLTGTRNIPLLEPFYPERNKDYFLGLRVALESVESFPIDDGEPELVFKLKVVYPETLKEIGASEQIQIGKGYTPSQVQRFALNSMLLRLGKDDTRENYEKVMGLLLDFINGIESWEDFNRIKKV